MTRRDWTLIGLCWLVAGVTDAQTWVHVPAIRQAAANLGPTLQALESRMPANHHYRSSDWATWSHETTHGLNADIRNRLFSRGHRNHTCAFVPPEWCGLVYNPPSVSLMAVSANVPQSWRGGSFQLYMVDQARKYYTDEPAWILNEWAAYTNGTMTTYETGRDITESEPRQMVEMMGYAWVFAAMSPDASKDVHGFVGWYSLNTVRTLDMIQSRVPVAQARRHLQTLRTSTDGVRIRAACVARFGEEWRREVLG